MPFVLSQGRRLSWRQDGKEGAPALLLLAPFGTDCSIWEPVLPPLIERFCVLRMDVRGHSASDTPLAPYALSAAAQDILAVLDATGHSSAFLCGLSFGGIMAMETARLAPTRIDGLILAGTSATMSPPTPEQLLSYGFPVTSPEIANALVNGISKADPSDPAGCAGTARDEDLAAMLNGITAPTLVLGGTRDQVTPFAEHGARLAAILGARTCLLDAGHLACVEAPATFASALIDFIANIQDGGALQAARDTLYQAGLETRRKILGDAYVDTSLANMTAFNADFVAMATRSNWGEIWSRPGLDQRIRRFVVLSVTASLGRWEEFRLHVRLGLEQGVFTADELKELLLQLGVYAGIPVANTGFAEAAEIMRNLKSPDE